MDYLSELDLGVFCPKTITIPTESLSGDAITRISTRAFDSKGISRVTIPSSITHIGSNAFVSNGASKDSNNLPRSASSTEQIREVQNKQRVWVNRPDTPDECFDIQGDTIVDYDASCGSDIVIPSMVDGQMITTIGSAALRSK